MSGAAGEVVVYHTSDIHGRLGFGARLAQLVEPGALLVDCGDSLLGSATVYRTDEPVIAELRAAPYRAQALGNREFHYLQPLLARRAHALPAPLLCSNLLDVRGRPLPFARELRLSAGGLRVRFVALLVPQYRTGSGWEKIFGWRFLAPEVALRELQVDADAASDVTIVLSHLGLSADRELAQRWPTLAAIVGGHSHDLLPAPAVVNGVPIAHAGAFAQYAGRLVLRLEAGGRRSFSYSLVPLLAASA